MKKMLALLLAILLTVTCLVACGESKDPVDKDTGSATTSVSEDKSSDAKTDVVGSEGSLTLTGSDDVYTLTEPDDVLTLTEPDDVLTLTETDMVSSPSKKEEYDDKAPVILTAETIVGPWEGDYILQAKDGREVNIKVVLKFSYASYELIFDKKSVEEYCWKSFEGYTLKDVRGLYFDTEEGAASFDQYVAKMLDDGWTEKELVEALLEEYISEEILDNLSTEYGDFEMTEKGVMRFDGEKVSYTYENGILTISVFDEEGITTTLVLTK